MPSFENVRNAEYWNSADRRAIRRIIEIERRMDADFVSEVQILSDWEATQPHRRRRQPFASFAHLMRALGLEIDCEVYNRVRDALRMEGTRTVRFIGVWASYYAGAPGVTTEQRARYVQDIRTWINQHGRTPRQSTARAHLKKYAPHAIKAMRNSDPQVERLRRQLEETRRRCRELTAHLRAQLREERTRRRRAERERDRALSAVKRWKKDAQTAKREARRRKR